MNLKTILYTLLISVQLVAVVMLRTLGFQQSGSFIFEVICYIVAAIPIVVIAAIFLKNGRSFHLRTLMCLMTLAAIFVYASVVPIVNTRRGHEVGMKLVSRNAEIERNFDWTKYYDDLGLNSAHSIVPSDGWMPFWLTPFIRDYLRNPADCEIEQLNLYSDEQLAILCERPERFASLRAVAVARGVSESGLGKLAEALPKLPSLEAVCLHDVRTPEGFYKSLTNIRTIWIWSQGKYRGNFIARDDISDIASLPQIETLMIQGYGLSDTETNAVTSETNLRCLLLRDSFITVTPSEIQRLEECGITMR